LFIYFLKDERFILAVVSEVSVYGLWVPLPITKQDHHGGGHAKILIFSRPSGSKEGSWLSLVALFYFFVCLRQPLKQKIVQIGFKFTVLLLQPMEY
jgi:hypothetical protein